MNSEKYFKNVLFFIAVIILTVSLSRPSFSYEFIDWNNWDIGYDIALRDAEDYESPLIIYFHKDTEPESQKMTEEFIAQSDVEDFLDAILKSELEPVVDYRAEATAQKYGVENYPALVVLIPSIMTEPQIVDPYMDGGKLTVDEFIGNIREIITFNYSEKAHQLFGEERFEDALKYLEKSLEIDPDRAYTHYALAIAYHTIAIKDKDIHIFEKAERSYKRAMELDPEDKDSEAGLKDLYDDIEKLGLN